ncbi:hypothetical protein ABID49_000191 [Bhargavaea ullalensis]|uniref:Uncharacterized protein n=1 Tax=Bhargavaea ullalensis TaxID=1265685 RepID=A0ABV2G7P7_9BACL
MRMLDREGRRRLKAARAAARGNAPRSAGPKSSRPAGMPPLRAPRGEGRRAGIRAAPSQTRVEPRIQGVSVMKTGTPF